MAALSKAVKSTQRLMRLMTVIVDGTGTAALSGLCSGQATLTDSGTGDYLITPTVPFARAPQVIATPVTNDIICKIGTVSASSVQILTENLSGAATDADFHCFIVGSDAEDAI